jgi:hypothetical protein
MRTTLSLAAAALCLALSSTALANIAAPDDPNRDRAGKRRENTLRLVIEAGDGPEAQIWLPPSMLAAAPGDAGAAGATAAGLPPLQTAGAGVALSLSLVFAGLWLARGRRGLGTRAAASAAVALAALAGTAAYALANAAPPRNYRAVDPGTLLLATPDGEPLAGTARYYYGHDEGVVRVVLPKAKKQ